MNFLYRIFGKQSPGERLAEARVELARLEADCRWLSDENRRLKERIEVIETPADDWKRRALEAEARNQALQEIKLDALSRVSRMEGDLAESRNREMVTVDRMTERILEIFPHRREPAAQPQPGDGGVRPRSKAELVREAEQADYEEFERLQKLADDINSGRPLPNEDQLDEEQDEFLKTFNQVVEHHDRNGRATEAVGN